MTLKEFTNKKCLSFDWWLDEVSMDIKGVTPSEASFKISQMTSDDRFILEASQIVGKLEYIEKFADGLKSWCVDMRSEIKLIPPSK